MACSGRADLMLQGKGYIMRFLDTPGCRHDHLHLHTRHASLSSITMGATHRGSGKFSACYLICAPQHPGCPMASWTLFPASLGCGDGSMRESQGRCSRAQAVTQAPAVGGHGPDTGHRPPQ